MFLENWVSGIRTALGEWDAVLAAEESEPFAAYAERALFGRLIAVPIFAARGEMEEARRRLDEVRIAVDPEELQGVVGFNTAEAEVLLAEGRPREALATAEAALALRDDIAGGLGMMADTFAQALEAAFTLQDEAKVDELLAVVERLSPGDLTPYLRAVGARFSAERAARSGDHATATAGFAAAAGLYREAEQPFDLAVVLLEHAEWLSSAGRLEEAEPLAAEAQEIFERLRAMPYVERVNRLPTGAVAAR